MRAFVVVLLLVSSAGAAELSHARFQLPLVDGEVSRRERGDEGLARVKTPAVDQLVSWYPARPTLLASVDHERALMLKAAQEAQAATSVTPFVPQKKPGRGAMTWTARLAGTFVSATVVDCGTHHVLLSSMGAGTEKVEAAHARSMEGFRCRK